LADFASTLFPLDTTQVLVTHFPDALSEFVDNCLNQDVRVEFPSQQRCYAAKHELFLRRTVKLDPAAEWFLYDVVYRNRNSFRNDHRSTRKSFGYRFDGGRPEPASIAYGAFKFAVFMAEVSHEHTLCTDVATYFNAIYHHDITKMVRNLGWPDADSTALGKFLRHINAGRSQDCLPHGLHPSKVLGAEFLRFVDDSASLKSARIVRFMDDIHLFDDSRETLHTDLLTLQELLGQRGLSLNTAKTHEDSACSPEIADEIREIKAGLLKARRRTIAGRYADDGSSDGDDEELTQEEIDFLLKLISSTDVEEADAELVLVLLRDQGEEVLPHMLRHLSRFPGLSKNLYTFVRFSEPLPDLDARLLEHLRWKAPATEFQLFWLTKIATDFLRDSARLGEILITAYQHPNATALTKAKVLEVPEDRFGLPDLRNEQLRSGGSNWLAWAAAAGARDEDPASRNHLFKYFRNASPMNELVSRCISQLR